VKKVLVADRCLNVKRVTESLAISALNAIQQAWSVPLMAGTGREGSRMSGAAGRKRHLPAPPSVVADELVIRTQESEP
jgi:hypothetical protein